jgi:hypothetical protein
MYPFGFQRFEREIQLELSRCSCLARRMANGSPELPLDRMKRPHGLAGFAGDFPQPLLLRAATAVPKLHS